MANCERCHTNCSCKGHPMTIECERFTGATPGGNYAHLLKLGKPTHFRPSNKNVTACGIIGPVYMAYDGRDCDCLRCKQTKDYKTYMGIKSV